MSRKFQSGCQTFRTNRCTGRLPASMNRRTLLQNCATGFAWTSLAAVMQSQAKAESPLAATVPGQIESKVKSVIFLFMDGGVSHVDSFDPKPALEKHEGEPWSGDPTRKWVKSPWKFSQHGQSGTPVSELFPHIASCVDDIAVIRSMKADLPIHSTGVLLLNTGHNLAGRPSLGSWINYGLGTENENLPGYVVLSFGHVPVGGMEAFGSGFLPSTHEATILRAEGEPIENLKNVGSPTIQLAKLDLLREQDSRFANQLGGDETVESAIRNYELAARMQIMVPDVLDDSKETQTTRDLYGLDDPDSNTKLYARQCLRARRLVESGVRFIQVNCPYGLSNGTWDQHGGLKAGHEKNAKQTDRAVAGLIKDLKQRGLLDSTLIVWAGEFGRTPHGPGTDGRDHHPEGFSVFLAGGGVRGGMVYGATDEFGVHAVEKICDIHDLHATILHLCGIDHEHLTFRSGGRDFRLTDVHGKVIRSILQGT